MENIIKKLKRLKEIQPDLKYCQYSKLVILATPIVEKLIVEKLKVFREIGPDPEYCRISKLTILAVPLISQKTPIFNWKLAFSLAGLLLVLISGSLLHYLKPSAPNLSAQALETDLQNLNINIQLAKIEYYQKSGEIVSLALKEISENQISHLNPLILESEKEQLEESSSINENIENLLNQLLL